MTTIPAHFRIETRPIADPQAIVRGQGVRITLLTSRLVRLEYSPDNDFEDRPSQIFWYRQQPVPAFNVHTSGDDINIETEHLQIACQAGQPFTPKSLSITIKANGHTWHPGDIDHANLFGTARTLDRVDGSLPLEPGLISREGWALVDDSNGLVFNEQGWIEERKEGQDLYFFGYAQDFTGLLADFQQVSGPPAIVPRWVLGNWWSRYWAFTQAELSQLMLDFKAHEIPLSVCIVDMDWHITKTGNTSSGWTGYTWNKTLFPDPPGFIQFLHSLNLHTALNLHPAAGIHPHEAAYPAMARAMGIDPVSQQPVTFQITDPTFANAYLTLLHHPLEVQGVDFWWMDWQQGNPSPFPHLNLLWWINHLHFLDLARDGVRRPFIFSRWGGLGNQRYPIGFSGDTVVSWASLAFQPYFTATAANVAYGWWSHDIGGHMSGTEEAELYTRWVQYGVFSPIFRLHCTANPYHERRPWGYDAETEKNARHAMQLRHALIPYIYSMAYRDHASGKALVRPLYHTHSEHDEAYACPDQYWFGSELLAAPFTSPQDSDTHLSRQVIWLPAGDWYDFFSGEHYPGDAWYACYETLAETPVFARAGAIVPLAPLPAWGGVMNPRQLTLHIFPGADNTFELYEDDGETTAYLGGKFALTRFAQSWRPEKVKFSISPAEGEPECIPQLREYRLVFHGVKPAQQLTALHNDDPIDIPFTYATAENRLTLDWVALSPTDSLEVNLEIAPVVAPGAPFDPQPTLRRLIKEFHLASEAKSALQANLARLIADPESVAAYQSVLSPSQAQALLEVLTGSGFDHNPHTGEELIVLWNNRSADTAYTFAIEHMRRHAPQSRYSLSQGKLPRFQAFRPAQMVPDPTWPWKLRVQYPGLFSYTLENQAEYRETPRE